jgi:hypothetical protein
LRWVGINVFAWVDGVEAAVAKLLRYGSEVGRTMNKSDLQKIGLLLQEVAAQKLALARRLESPQLWQYGPSGERSYRGREIEKIVELLNQVNLLGRRLDPKWQTSNFELTGYMKAVLADKFVLVDKVHFMVQDGDSWRGETKSIEPHVAVVVNGLPSYRKNASELARSFREEAKRLSALSKQVSDASR